MNAEKAAAKSAALSRAAQDARRKIIGVAGHRQNIRFGEMRGQRRQRGRGHRHIVIHQVNERKACRTHTPVCRGRKAQLARAAFEAHFRPVCLQPLLAIVCAAIVGNQNFGRLPTGAFEAARRLDHTGQEFLEQRAAVPVGDDDTDSRRAQRANPRPSVEIRSAQT